MVEKGASLWRVDPSHRTVFEGFCQAPILVEDSLQRLGLSGVPTKHTAARKAMRNELRYRCATPQNDDALSTSEQCKVMGEPCSKLREGQGKNSQPNNSLCDPRRAKISDSSPALR